MPSQALSFGEGMVGAFLLTMGISGANAREVLAGKGGKIKPIKGASTATVSGGTTAPTSAAGGGSDSAAFGPGEGSAPPGSKRTARLLKGLGHYDGHPVALWIIPFLAYARAHGWKGHVESGYRTPAEELAAAENYGRSHYATWPPHSNHELKNFPGGAVDVTEAAQLSEILQKLPGGSLLKWAGAADEVHFSFPHNGGF